MQLWKSRLGHINYHKGKKAEDFAVEFLKQNGAKILARRWKVSGGEIDIVAIQDNQLAIVEVKARADKQTAQQAITAAQRNRIQNAATAAWAKWENMAQSMRFDLIVVLPDHTVLHYPDWWRIYDWQ